MFDPKPTQDENPPVVIRLSGEYDIYRRDELARELSTAYNAQEVVLDLSDVPYIDSTAIGCLVALKKRMSQNGPAVIRIVGVQRNVRRILELTQLEKIFNVD